MLTNAGYKWDSHDGASPDEVSDLNPDKRFDILRPDRNVAYGPQDLPSARDGQIRDLLVRAVGEMSFEELKALMPLGADGVLGSFAERAASIAVRHQDVRELRAGLLAAAAALDLTDDPREILPRLSLLHRAAEMIGNDPAVEFRQADQVLKGKAPELVKFLERSPFDRSIQAMAYEEGNDKHGFRFLRTW
ncbi:hypothetical protein BWI15_12690 [Kribbella sp. ALI-6-A]|uniref:hypothetical protein n=1 Tax=Kribbella sp. ALI-6-A TaxID=1933817 RepID=UPI00097CAE51|nr:hypothetical protein [Kribbella sp. ALI-6-A]ONI74202.1 hypothetical protein BWI15_12690 [Kribbella sp. ALI-6-A]